MRISSSSLLSCSRSACWFWRSSPIWFWSPCWPRWPCCRAAGGAGPGPAGRCGRAIAAACGSCRRARRAPTSCRRRRRPARRRAAPSADSPASAAALRAAACAASLAPERASRSMRSIMLRRSCGRSLRVIRIERPRHLRVLAHLLGQRLHELVERGAQLVRQLLDLLVGRAALQRLAQRFLRGAQAPARPRRRCRPRWCTAIAHSRATTSRSPSSLSARASCQ